jgi:hypothetical protein
MKLSKMIQMVYTNVIESSSDEESDDDSDLMMVATMLLHKHTSRPVYMGSVMTHEPQGQYQAQVREGPLSTLLGLLSSYQANL